MLFVLLLSLFALPLAPMNGGEPRVEVAIREEVYPVVILGGGIGALTASLYLARAEQQPLVIVGKTPGGLLTQSHTVQNWPGEFEIDGTALTEKVRKQAEANGAVFQNEEVVGVDFAERPFTITTRPLGGEKLRTVRAEAVIIAMGTEPNFLNVPGETGPNGYWGRGVTNCAICDGNLYRDQVVGVVGGGDAAVLEALYLSNIARQVFVFVRKDALKAIEEKRIQTLLAKPNVEILYQTAVQEIRGDGAKLTHVVLKTGDKAPSPLPLDGLFLAIGSQPNSALFKGALRLDKGGYIGLSKDQQTSVEGVYALGDIVDPVYKQAISAAGDGAKAALQAQQYVSDRRNGLTVKTKTVKAFEAALAHAVIEVSSREQFEREIRAGGIPVVVDFYASWCGPCKSLSPILESSANHLSGKVKFLKINVDKFNDLTHSYNIRAMPTVLIFDSSGTVVERKVGMDQIADLLKRLETENKI